MDWFLFLFLFCFFLYVFFFIFFFFFFLMIRRPPRSTLFPTRRSSDLTPHLRELALEIASGFLHHRGRPVPSGSTRDRKSTRLNSSHVRISYAVFCLKKKKHNKFVTVKK